MHAGSTHFISFTKLSLFHTHTHTHMQTQLLTHAYTYLNVHTNTNETEKIRHFYKKAKCQMRKFVFHVHCPNVNSIITSALCSNCMNNGGLINMGLCGLIFTVVDYVWSGIIATQFKYSAYYFLIVCKTASIMQ